MATTQNTNNHENTTQELEKNNSTTNPFETYAHLISTLPNDNGWELPIRLYKNYWIPEHILPNMLSVEPIFKPRPTDVILVTMPKAGTTWLKALAFAVVNRDTYSFAEHPLLVKNPHECVPFLEIPYHREGVTSTIADIEKLPSPRLLATHMPISLLPASTIDSGCRIIYICRDPKDILVSLCNFTKTYANKNVDIGHALDLLCEGRSPYGPFWDSVLEHWNGSIKRPEQVLFLKFEEMMKDSSGCVKRLAEFLGCPFTEEEERNGAVEQIVKLCSFENLSGLDVNKKSKAVAGGAVISQSIYFRNGKVGDWKNHISDEMGEKLNTILKEKLYGSGLVF